MMERNLMKRLYFLEEYNMVREVILWDNNHDLTDVLITFKIKNNNEWLEVNIYSDIYHLFSLHENDKITLVIGNLINSDLEFIKTNHNNRYCSCYEFKVTDKKYNNIVRYLEELLFGYSMQNRIKLGLQANMNDYKLKDLLTTSGFLSVNDKNLVLKFNNDVGRLDDYLKYLGFTEHEGIFGKTMHYVHENCSIKIIISISDNKCTLEMRKYGHGGIGLLSLFRAGDLVKAFNDGYEIGFDDASESYY